MLPCGELQERSRKLSLIPAHWRASGKRAAQRRLKPSRILGPMRYPAIAQSAGAVGLALPVRTFGFHVQNCDYGHSVVLKAMTTAANTTLAHT